MIYLVQLLCPHRHCIGAMVFDKATCAPSEAISDLREQLAKLGMNPWCGICGSSRLEYEVAMTRHATMEEAMPAILQSERANIATRAALDAQGLTYDSRTGKQN